MWSSKSMKAPSVSAAVAFMVRIPPPQKRSLSPSSSVRTMESAAAAAAVSRTTAYRYFPNLPALLAAAYPHIEKRSLLGPNPPEDPAARLAIVVDDHTRRIFENEPEM